MPEPKSSLSPLFPGDIGHTEHYTFSAPNCSAVSSCTVNQLPSFTSWRHQLFRVSFVLRPTNDCTGKKPDELIMQTRQQCAHDQLQDRSPIKLYNNGCCTLNWTAWLSKGHECFNRKRTGTCCIGLCQLYLKDLEVLWYIEGD